MNQVIVLIPIALFSGCWGSLLSSGRSRLASMTTCKGRRNASWMMTMTTNLRRGHATVKFERRCADLSIFGRVRFLTCVKDNRRGR